MLVIEVEQLAALLKAQMKQTNKQTNGSKPVAERRADAVHKSEKVHKSIQAASFQP